jgi:hypothetical protein
MDQATQFVQANSSILSTVTILVVLIAILYVVYTYLYPAEDPTYTRFLKGEADARKPIHMKHTKVPAIYTGGDFTFSAWIYIDDWNYRASKYKFLFAISPANSSTTKHNPLTCLLTPLQNSLLVRTSTVGSKHSSAPGSTVATGSATPDISIESNLQQLMKQQTSMTMFQNTVDTPCDVKEVPLQRWVNITIVSSGRVLDVYMDGKLSRSCVLDNVVNVPRGPLVLRMGEHEGFGGRYSSVQMWNQQLTPDVIYGIYQMGPTQTQHDLFTEVAKYLNLNVSFTGSAPGQPVPPVGAGFGQLYNEAGVAYADAKADASYAYNATTGEGQALMARF